MDALIHFFTGLFLPFLLVITVLVFVHELGHYLVARWNGVKVEAFSIGMGPELFGFHDKARTRWKFCLFPIGGYVKMFGDADIASRPMASAAADEAGAGADTGPATGADTNTSSDASSPAKSWASGGLRRLSEEEKAQSFHHKRVGQRFAIVLAGPLANFIFTVVVLYFMLLAIGQAVTPAVVGSVLEGSPAEAAGLRAGDEILSMDGREVERFQDLQRYVQIALDREIQMDVLRGSERLTLALVPEMVEVEDITGRTVRTPRLGIAASGTRFERLGPLEAAGGAVRETWEIASLTLRAVGQIVVGRRGTEDLGGPVRIAELSGKMVENGVASLLWFMALLSLNLGIINLFPIPVLDGGHLVFYAYEWARGRPMPERVQAAGYRIGLALVLALFAFVFWNDLSFYFVR